MRIDRGLSALFVFVRAFVAAEGYAFGVADPRRRLEKQPSFYESAVVEHKAQTHFEGLLYLSDCVVLLSLPHPCTF